MGWCWGVFVFGFIATFHLLFMEIAGGRPGAVAGRRGRRSCSRRSSSSGASARFLASSVALGVVAAHRLVFATRRREKWLWGIGLGWSAGAFALTLYPPFQVVMGWFGVFAFVGLSLRSLKRGRAVRWDRDLALGALAALGIATFAALHLFQIAGDAIAATQHTLYPGQRFATGGATSWWKIFSNNVYPHFFVRASPSLGENICEAASFITIRTS